jgi:glycosyltransferase involved in cell wall biosynthesis
MPKRLLVIRSNVLGNKVLGEYVEGALRSLTDLEQVRIDLNAEQVHGSPMPYLLRRSILARNHRALSRSMRARGIKVDLFDAVLCNSFTSLLALGTAFRSLPRACVFDGSSFAHRELIPSSRRTPTWTERLKARTYTRYLGNKVVLLPMSEWARTAHEKYFTAMRPMRTVVCPPYSRLEAAGSVESCVGTDPESSESSDIKLLFVGNYLREKGGHDLIRLFLERLHKCCSLTIVTSQQVPETHPKLTVRNDVRVSHSAEIKRIYRTHDLFVFPSMIDRFGLVVLEAMSQGLPVVAYDVAAMGEMVKHGVNGQLIPFSDNRLATLADCVEHLATNPDGLRAMGDNSLRLLEKGFTRERFESTIREAVGVMLA